MAEEKAVKEAKVKKLADPVAATIDPASQQMIAHIDKKRQVLGIEKAREGILVDMDTRRELETAQSVSILKMPDCNKNSTKGGIQLWVL